MNFTDSHCHIDFPAFDNERRTILEQCCQNNINKIIVPAVSPSKWQSLLDITKNNTTNCQLYPCLGIHPWYLNNLHDNHLLQLEKMIFDNRQKIIAIGETGLDGVIALEQNNLAKQQAFFEFHIIMANQFNLPLIVHHRRTHPQIFQQLKSTKVNKRGVIHAFSGSYQQGKSYIDLGFKLGIGGTISYSRAEKTIKAVKRFPLESLVLETDASAMPLQGMQGKDNSPLMLSPIFEILVSLRSESKEEIAETIENNIEQIFKLKPL